MDQHDAIPDRLVAFGPFTLDPVGGQLWRDKTVVPLRRKALDVLRFLASRRGRVVSNEELLDAVWPRVHVTPQTLTNVIRELRIALDDPARAPRFLHTLHRQGHLLVPTDAELAHATSAMAPAADRCMVGRDDELGRLTALWRDALGGRSRVVFVTGEPGIGKTTLVDALVQSLAGTAAVRIAYGTCVEQHGQDEAYVPILGAIDELLDGDDGEEVVATLRRSAPTWLVQLPWRLSNRDHERLESALLGTTSARMLREGLNLLRTLAGAGPLLLVLEDLHWSDLATLDLVAALARRPLAVPLLVVGTYRRVDATIRAHPLVQVARDLRRTGAVTEVALPPFDVPAVRAYLAARFGSATFPDAVLASLVDHSAGNPLFLRALVDELVTRGAIVSHDDAWQLAGDPAAFLLDLPESLRDFVLAELAAMEPAIREAVEAASVVGLEFTAPEVAATLERSAADVENACEDLARIGRIVHFADAAGADLRRYAFVHAAHRRIAYEQTGPVRRQALHLAAARALHETSGGADAVAGRLALHYERAGDVTRAVEQLDRAATYAERRFAYRESASYLRTALAHLDGLAAHDPGSIARTGFMSLRLGVMLAVNVGFATRETEDAFERARAIGSAHDQPTILFMAEMALCRLHLARGDVTRGRDHSARMLALARTRVPELTVVACCWGGFAASSLGDLPRARALLEEGMAAPPVPNIGHADTERMIGSQLAAVLAVMGDPTSDAIGEAALARSVAASRPADLVHALVQAAERAVFVRDPRGLAAAAQAVALAEESENPTFLWLAHFYHAALDADRPGIERLASMQAAIAARHALGDRFQDSVLLASIAELQIELGDLRGAAATLDEADAHVAASGERHHEPEILRLHGVVALAGDDRDAKVTAAALFRSAIELATARGAGLWELRAATALAAIDLPKTERTVARKQLTSIVDRFDAACTSHDVSTARHVLAARA